MPELWWGVLIIKCNHLLSKRSIHLLIRFSARPTIPNEKAAKNAITQSVATPNTPKSTVTPQTYNKLPTVKLYRPSLHLGFLSSSFEFESTFVVDVSDLVGVLYLRTSGVMRLSVLESLSMQNVKNNNTLNRFIVRK